MPPDPQLVHDLETYLSAEFAKAFSLAVDGRLHRLLDPLFRLPSRRVARLLADADAATAAHGISHAARRLAARLVVPAAVHGREHIPPDGPLLVVANHPGAYDSLVLIDTVARDDLLIVTSTIPALLRLPHVAPHFVPVRRGAGHAMAMATRAAAHLNTGGAVLIFPSGRIDPDPDSRPATPADSAAGLDGWSSSIGLLLQAAPTASVLVAVISSIIAPRWEQSLPARLHADGHARRRLAEFLQVSQLVLTGRRSRRVPRLTFAPPLLPPVAAPGADAAHIRDYLAAQAQHLLARHRALRPSA